MEENWDFLLSEFRRLGGIADNVCQKEGEYGRGIFSVNPSQRARIFTPSKLLIKKDDIYLEDNKLRIKKDKEYNQEIRDFFNFYQDNFSWGSSGKETTELFEKGLILFNSGMILFLILFLVNFRSLFEMSVIGTILFSEQIFSVVIL